MRSLLASNVKPYLSSGKRMVSPPLVTCTTSTAQIIESISRLLHIFLSQTESEKIKRLCVVSKINQKLFWKLIKGQRSTSQMNVDGNVLTDKIREMWDDHFESLGTPSNTSNFDNDFYHHVTTRVHGVLKTSMEDPSGVLCEPLEYEEVAHVCSRLKQGVASISIDYEHIRYTGQTLWKALFCLYRVFFESGSACQILKTRVILPLFKGKGAKVTN